MKDATRMLWENYATTHNPEIKDTLVLKYMPIVKYVASKMLMTLPSSVDYNDLVSAGILGLIGAMDRFDIRQGVKFETFVLPRIRGAILDELRTLDWAPRSLRSKARKLERTVNSLEKELGRVATDEEVVNRLDMKLDDYYYIQKEINSAALLSLDGSIHDESDSNTSMYDMIENPIAENPLASIENHEMKKVLLNVIDNLPEQEKLVISLYYYEELTLREIGQVMDITESRVSQIHTKAISNLKHKMHDEIMN
ncbi:FliA/WhiG family RNA polymerase sigma factor [candidate division KSB1 bacterium]|nr:FliA/WhiG family RNA polymerase sigma factor [candidate division KSB1 bacterium]